MKKIAFLAAIALAFGFYSCNSQQDTNNKMRTDVVKNPSTASGKEEDGRLPEFEFTEEAYEFGEISQGEKVTKQFTFKNIGNADLVISDAKGSCGCTVPVYPTNPIAPGEEGVIEVVFDSNGKKGRVHNTVTLVANTVPNTKVLVIKGDVLTPNK